MTQREDHLDALIDELISGERDSAEAIKVDDREIIELVDLAREVQMLREPDWPGEEFPKALAAQVTARMQQGTMGAEPEPGLNGSDRGNIANLDHHQQAAIPREDIPEQPIWRWRARQLAEMVAASIVLILITGALILAYQNLIGDETSTPGTGDLASPGEGVPTLTNLGTIENNHSYTGATVGEIDGQEYAFIAITLRDGIEIYELDPEGDHSRVGTIDLLQDLGSAIPENPHGLFAMAAADGWLYIAMPSDDEPTVRAYDVSDPASPSEPIEFGTQTGQGSTAWTNPHLFTVHKGSLATVDMSNDQLILVDVTDPYEPIPSGTYSTGHRDVPTDLEIIDSRIYLTYDDALEIIDISDPGTPVLIGALESQYRDGLDEESTIEALEASESKSEVLDHSVSADRFLDTTLVGDYAYIALGGQRLVVADVSEPAAPEEVALIEREDQPADGHAVGDFLFLYEIGATLDSEDGEFSLTSAMRVLDVSSPTEPEEIETLDGILPSVELGRVYNFLGFPHAGERFHIVQEPQGVHVLRVDWYEAPRDDESAVDDASEVPSIDLEDPREFATEMITAIEAEDWNRLRGMLIEPFSSYDDDNAVATLFIHDRARAERVDDATNPESWDVEEYSNWVTVRHRDDPAFSISFVNEDSGPRIKPGPFLRYFAQLAQDTGSHADPAERLDDLYLDVLDQQMTSTDEAGISLSGLFDARPATVPDDDGDPLVTFEVSVSQQESISIDVTDMSWQIGEQTGPAELVWTDARLDDDERRAGVPSGEGEQFWFELRLSGMEHTVDPVTVTFGDIQVETEVGAVMPGAMEEVTFSASYEFVHSRGYGIVAQSDDGAVMTGEYISALDFPHIEEAEIVDALTLDPDTLQLDEFEFEVIDGSASLHRTGARIQDLGRHYTHPDGSVLNNGWQIHGTPRSSHVAFFVLQQHDALRLYEDIVVLMFVHSRDLDHVSVDSPFMPFDLEIEAFGSDTGFIQTVRFTCDSRGIEGGCRGITLHLRELLND